MSKYVIGTKRKCVICGETFGIKQWNQKTCSKQCQTELGRRNKRKKLVDGIRTCPVCGKEFKVRSSDQVYCSRKCSAQGHKEHKDKTVRRPDHCKIMITTQVPVYDRLEPRVGCIYDAEIGRANGIVNGSNYYIICVHGHKLIVRGSECVVVETEQQKPGGK